MPAKPAAAEVKLAEPEVATDEKTIQLVDEKILKAAVPENQPSKEVAKLDTIKDQETLQQQMTCCTN